VRIIIFFIIALFLLCQIFGISSASASEGCVLNPPSRAENPSFRQLYGTSCLAITIYKLDAIEGLHKDVIMRQHSAALFNDAIRFDLEKIYTQKKGFTRYYPVTVEGKVFVVRVFLTKELPYQPRLTVLYEVSITDPEVTCQILSSVNDIVSSRKIEPVTYPQISPVDISL
jgi:hypothetical protein